MIRICPILRNNDFELFNKVLNTGFNSVRFNFSHLNINTANEYCNFIKKNFPNCKIIQDLQGHKIRIGNIEDTLKIKQNSIIIFTPENYFSSTYNGYIQVPLAFENYNILTNTKKFIIENKNGPAEIIVEEEIIENNKILFKCLVKKDIVLRKEKGINAIGFNRAKLPLSKKDKTDILWGVLNQADIIIYSFASSAAQITELKEYINSVGNYMPKIWAKIENQEGIDNIDEILSVCDGIMIGRGDLSVEIPISKIPEIQSLLIDKCKTKQKDCIIATYIYDNFANKNIDNISDITSLYYLYKDGATGFMPANEIIFSEYPEKISNHFNSYINYLEDRTYE